MKDVFSFLTWYVVMLLIGGIAFPIAYRFFPRLASKGYAFAKPLGLLIWGYLFWILNSLGILQNSLGGEVVALILLGLLALVSLANGKAREIWHWVHGNWKTILVVEGVFLVFFAGWAAVRATAPDISGTEKPMELAFINSILVSPSFPPQDPWLSGYAISYYYFGYVLIAMLIRISGVVSGVGYNLTSGLWFGLTATAAFGMVYDLTAFWRREKEQLSTIIYNDASKLFARWAGILGSFFVLLVSNMEGLLEVLHSKGLFWQTAANGTQTSKFWTWLGILDLNQPPTLPLSWIPSRYLVWWRGSRVISDLSVLNNRIEIIDEFPFFSYLLSDLHPHVLAMPFDLMAMGICLNLFVAGVEGSWPNYRIRNWFAHWEFWLTALILGSMAFFNTWDFPMYVGLYCLVLIYLKIRQKGWSGNRIWEFILYGVTFGIIGGILFLPFFWAFKSQAGGFLPSLEYMTRGINFWVMFMPLLVPIFFWLFFLWKKDGNRKKFLQGLKYALILVAGLWLLSSLIGMLFFTANTLGGQWVSSSNQLIAAIGNKLLIGGQAFVGLHGTTDGAAVIALSLTRRLVSPGTWLTLTLLLVLLWGLFSRGIQPEAEINTESSASPQKPQIKAETFVLFLVLMGAGLTLFPEFFYLRDQFGNRMNTIFKFYFQTWMFWGISAAFATAVLWHELKKWRHTIFTVVWTVVIAGALVYTVVMLLNRTNNFRPLQWTLDGNAYLELYHPDEVKAMDWLETQPMAVVSEAVGGSYTEYARVSEQTGFPTVLGWPGHELQWRGGATEMGSRMTDISTLYQTGDWTEASAIISRYQIRYIFVGYLEESTYHLSLDKFNQNLKVVYQNQTATIYEVPDVYLKAGQ